MTRRKPLQAWLRAIRLSLAAGIVGVLLCAAPLAAQASTARDAIDSVVMVAERDARGAMLGWGTGFAIGETGKPIQYIVTNYHVIKKAYEGNGTVLVYFSSAANRFMQAEVYWKNQSKDLAVLKLPEPTEERQALALCPMKQVNVDDTFSALGYPGAGMAGNDFPKFDKSDVVVTRGGIAKETRVNETDCYLLDLEISEGNSGGPLVNSKGEVVGINSFYIATADQTGGQIKSNYAVAIDELMRGINTDVIPVTIVNPYRTALLIAGVAAAAVVVIAVVVILILVLKKKKQPTGTSASADGTGTWAVRGISGPFQDQTFPIGGGLQIGRDPQACGIVYPLDHPGISAVHCRVAVQGDGVTLTDLQSSYGTFRDDRKLAPNETEMLKAGDIFYLADKTNSFQVIR